MAPVHDRVTEEASSLPVDADDEVDHAWAEEAERRLDQAEAGEAKMHAGEEVISRLHAKYRR